ncbi:MAG TPA: OB-fold nucleic acid binding domain-containing protein, partial [Terriglobia bacterium]|nr:OB-fold nucleic acid binding domain-containing protein [Terriglobia bacterium]
MKASFVRDLTPDQPVRSTFLVQTKERKIASNGSAYLDLELRDSSGSVKAKLWDCDRLNPDFAADDIVQVEGMVEEYRGGLQLKIRRIAKCAGGEFDLLDYFPRSARDPEEMFAALLDRLKRVPEGPLRSLMISVVEDPEIAPRLKLAPAATSFHHAYLGGLLEHILSLIGMGDQVCDHYPSLDRDLVLAGLVLHDLGKLEELGYERGFHYTTRGQLIGHISIGLELVQTKIRALPDFPAALKDRLEHIILSHHGKLEFGSPKEPAFPEALVVHYL